MVYYDRILLPISVVPPFPEEILEYYQEEVGSFVNYFLHIFVFANDSGDVPAQFIYRALEEIESNKDDVTPNRSVHVQYMNQMVELYRTFERNVQHMLAFLHRLPPYVIIEEVTGRLYNADTLLVILDYRARD